MSERASKSAKNGNKCQYISVPSIRRLPLYFNILKEMKEGGLEYASGTVIAERLGVLPIQVRKDLAITGVTGKPKLGFPITELLQAIDHFLGWDNAQDAFLVGVGNLGMALIGYENFKEKGINIVAAFDNDPDKIGTRIKDCEVLALVKLENLLKRMKVKIGILTVPDAFAQGIADVMVENGIRAIWNFTPVSLNVPDYVIVENVRLSSSLSVLTKKLTEMLEIEKKKVSKLKN